MIRLADSCAFTYEGTRRKLDKEPRVDLSTWRAPAIEHAQAGHRQLCLILFHRNRSCITLGRTLPQRKEICAQRIGLKVIAHGSS